MSAPYERAKPTPPAEVDIDVDLVHCLLKEQHSDLADLPLRIVDEGWDNVILRLGEEYSVRVPRRALAAPLADHEHRWLPVLAPRLPLDVPTPVRVGQPGCGYPWSWSVCRWLPGERAIDRPPDDEATTAVDLARFLVALHTEAPLDAPTNPFRGVPLAEREPWLIERVTRLGDAVDQSLVERVWERALATPAWPHPRVWTHGDLHLGNMLVRDGRLAAVIDFGDLGTGDPAVDISSAWLLFGREARERFRAALPHADDDTWERARGWALSLGLGLLADSNGDGGFIAMGHTALAALADDDSPG